MPDDPVETLRRNGRRVTGQRLAVLRAVTAGPHVTADVVAERVRTERGAISLQAVYDALAVLVDVGLVRRIEPAYSPALFEARVDDNHHHLICRDCGRVSDVDCAVGAAPCLTPAQDLGFQIDEAEVIYWGRCPECAATAAGSVIEAGPDLGIITTMPVGTPHRPAERPLHHRQERNT